MKLKVNGLHCFLCCCAMLIASDAYADVIRDHFEVIAGMGTSKANWADTKLGVTSSEVDTLAQTNSNNSNALVGQLGVGYVYYFQGADIYSQQSQWFPSIEPEFNFYASSNRIHGAVQRFGSPTFSDFNYSSTVKTARFMLDAALTVVSQREYSLFVIGGLGAARSNISYNDSPSAASSCTSITSLSLNSNNQNSFVWELGTGVAYAFNNRVNLSFEYLYTNFGSLKLPTSIKDGSVTNSQMTSSGSTFYTQAALLGLHVGIE